MASRSFPIQAVRMTIDDLIARTRRCQKIAESLPRDAVLLICAKLSQDFHIPPSTAGRKTDVEDHLRSTIVRLQGVFELAELPNGQTEVSLDSQDAIDLAFLRAYIAEVVDTQQKKG